MSTIKGRQLMFAAAFLVLHSATPPTRAELTITVTQVGSNVVASGSGTIDTTGLIASSTNFVISNMVPKSGKMELGPATAAAGFQLYTGISSGPSSIGTGVETNANSGSGQLLGPDGPGAMLLPTSYRSGSSLSATDTWDNKTFSSLGLTPGTYTWTWGTGADADSMTVDIGTAAVPEPSTAIVALFGSVAFIGYGWSRHRRAQRRQAAA
jgi:PEP-CTERM motif